MIALEKITSWSDKLYDNFEVDLRFAFWEEIKRFDTSTVLALSKFPTRKKLLKYFIVTMGDYIDQK